MTDNLHRIAVSFALEAGAAADAVRLNTVIAQRFESQILLGTGGNSCPHVTIALGEADHIALAPHRTVDEESTEAFRMSFSAAARETVTGRYVLADIALPQRVARWRSALRAKLAVHLSGLGRTSDTPHLTIAVIEGQALAVDQFLAVGAH